MERLKIVLLIAAIVATALTSFGQESDSSSPSTALEAGQSQLKYVVIGDVENHNYFPLPLDRKTSVQQAVLEAGIVTDSVSVSVVRGNQHRAAFTQMVSRASADTGELVMAGDILVVQSIQAVSERHQKNAALRIGGGTVPVTLSDDSIVVGDVLQQTGGLPSSDQQIKIACRFRGRPLLENASLSDRVEHGDVITIVQKGRSTPGGFGSMIPAVSEWQASAVAPAVSVKQQPDAVRVPDVAPEIPIELPVHTSEADVSESSRNPFADPSEPAASDAMELNLETQQGDTSIAVKSVSQAIVEPIADAAGIAPSVPEEIRIPIEAARQTPESSMGLWNMLFIGGLLIAGSMILIGSLRADEENMTSGDDKQQDTVKSVQSLPTPAASTKGSIESLATSSTATEIQSIVDRRIAAESLPDAAETQVWFGGDWRSSELRMSAAPVSKMPGACGSTTADSKITYQSQNEHPPIYLLEKMVVESLNDSNDSKGSSPASMLEQVTAEQRTEDAVSSSQQVQIREEFVSDSRASLPIRPLATVSAERADKELADLEDLLQNRLPVDLCQIELPLRVSLFGRPAGPRRLRIDAAHAQMPAPHMNISAERRREETVGVSSRQTDVEISAQREQAGEKKSAEAAASLDRALYYLHDRTDT